MEETKRKLTSKQARIVGIIGEKGGWVGPTEIGIACGRDYNSASSWCGATIKTLVKRGLIVRGDEAPNKGKYRLLTDGSDGEGPR